MRIGAIDIGTNSTRLLIADKKGNQLDKLLTELETPRLGEGINQTNRLKKEAIKRTSIVLKKYKQIINEFNAIPIVIATSAVRDASNQQQFINFISQKIGLKINVISGVEEARLSYLGITSVITNLSGQTLAIDIGGGSTEFILGKSDEFRKYKSINLGAVRLTEDYGEDLKKIKLVVKEMLPKIIEHKNFINLIGVGGTITTLAAIDQALEIYDANLVHEYELSRSTIEEISNKLSKLSLSKRKKVKGLESKRADIILSGIIILLEIMELANQNKIKVSESGILEGVIYDKDDI